MAIFKKDVKNVIHLKGPYLIYLKNLGLDELIL